jgi:hypothetical protein
MMRMKKALGALLLFAAADASAALSFRLRCSDSPDARVLADGTRMRLEFDNGMVLKTITIEAKEIRTDAADLTPAQLAIPAGYTKIKD